MGIKLWEEQGSGGWPAVRAGGTPAFGTTRHGDHTTLALVIVSTEGVVRSIHGQLQEGIPAPVVAAGAFDAFEPETERMLASHLARAGRGEVVAARFRTSTDGPRRFDATFIPMRLQDRVEAVAVVFRESSQQFARELERKILREALDASEDGLVIFGSQSLHVVFHNLAFSRLAGIAGPIVGQALRLPSAEAVARVERAVRAGQPTSFEITTSDEVAWIRELSLAPVGGTEADTDTWVGVLRDVTRRRAFEEQVRRAAALDAMGRMAAGAAHDFNNLLAAMTMELAFLREVVAGPEAQESLEGLDAAVHRARGVIGRLLASTRPDSSSPERMDLRNLVLETTQQVARLRTDIRFEAAAGDSPVWLFGDALQLEQVLHNLLSNAAEASPSGSVVRVELSTDTEQARLRVVDQGAGMSASVAARAFEPLFTTKGARGTGLGLTTVEGVIKAHGGSVVLRSAPMLGTTVTVTLPLFETTDAAAVEGPRQSGEFAHGGSRHVLVVEHQAILRAGIARTLERQGYRVTTARDGQEALERLSDDVAVVLSDIVMPGMDGVELARRVAMERNAVPVLLMSGFHDPIVGEIPAGVRLLPKPFRASALFGALEAVMR